VDHVAPEASPSMKIFGYQGGLHIQPECAADADTLAQIRAVILRLQLTDIHHGVVGGPAVGDVVKLNNQQPVIVGNVAIAKSVPYPDSG
jgi:hypothetical protein